MNATLPNDLVLDEYSCVCLKHEAFMMKHYEALHQFRLLSLLRFTYKSIPLYL